MTDNSIFDQLDIDPNEGIDPTEIAAIKATLARIKNSAARVAIDNDTSATLAILREVETAVRNVVKSGASSAVDVRSALAVNSTGQQAKQLGGSSGISQGELTDDERKFVAGLRNATLTEGQLGAINKIVIGIIKVTDDGSLADVEALKAELKDQQDKLVQEKDPKKVGSLAQQLELEKVKFGSSTSTRLPGMVEKAKIKTELDKLAPELDKLKNPSGALLGKAVDHKSKAQNALSSAANLVK